MTKKIAKTETKRTVVIEAPQFETAEIHIRGTSPYCQNRFSKKARDKMQADQEAGSRTNKNKKKEPRDFDADYEAAKHISREGWYGIPAPAFRNAMISACRVVGFKMTLAKLSVFIEADGYDAEDRIPLVKIMGEPHMDVAAVRNATGVVDLRARPMWDEWEAKVRVRWDAAQFSAQDVLNLLSRAGLQVGIGEGRPDGKSSAGLGWGMFEVVA